MRLGGGVRFCWLFASEEVLQGTVGNRMWIKQDRNPPTRGATDPEAETPERHRYTQPDGGLHICFPS